MHFLEVGGRRYAQFEQARGFPGLGHAFSTRPEDVSIGRGRTCAQRRSRMLLDFERDPERLACCRQIHQTRLEVVDQLEGPLLADGVDAICTRAPAVTLMTFSADCPLILLYDPRRGAVGLAHASWRCTVAALAGRLFDTMCRRLDCHPNDMYAGIGPSAGPQQYEVGQDVYEAAAELPERDSCFPVRDGRMFFDLWRANRLILETAGIPPGNIEIAGICTMTRTDLFYSYRREGRGCGHFGLMAGLAPA